MNEKESRYFSFKVRELILTLWTLVVLLVGTMIQITFYPSHFVSAVLIFVCMVVFLFSSGGSLLIFMLWTGKTTISEEDLEKCLKEIDDPTF